MRLIQAAVAIGLLMCLPMGVAAQGPQCLIQANVYFERSSAEVTEAADATLQAIAERIEKCDPAIVVVIGHVDAAEADMTPSLGEDRARAAAAVLRPHAGPVPVITEDAGHSDPARETAAGVSEPLNRRATVYFRAPSFLTETDVLGQ